MRRRGAGLWSTETTAHRFHTLLFPSSGVCEAAERESAASDRCVCGSPSEWLMGSHRAFLADDGTALNVDSHKHSGPSLILRGSSVYLTLHKLDESRNPWPSDDGWHSEGKCNQEAVDYRVILFGRWNGLLLHRPIFSLSRDIFSLLSRGPVEGNHQFNIYYFNRQRLIITQINITFI